VVADLAESVPVPTDDGKTYTFRLRRGLRYSTGAPVRASDVRRGIERLLLRRAGLATYYTGIRGSTRCGRRRCPQLASGIAADDAARTITFHLVAPDADFVSKLALPSAVAVPAGTPLRTPPRPLPATGPYRIDRVGKVTRLVRNPRFQPRDGRPDGYPDIITIDCCAGTRAPALVREGRSDLFAADFGVPPGLETTVAGLATRYPGRLHVTPLATTIYAVVDTAAPPFDNLDARRALNYAVDRAAFAGRKGGERFAQPTCQFLPPNFPGYQPYCPYTANAGPGRPWTGPDLAHARRLVRRSGTAGTRVKMLGWFGVNAPETRLLASILRSIGYRAEVRIRRERISQVDDVRREPQVAILGQQLDFQSPEAFLKPAVACATGPSAQELPSLNVSRYCDARTDALIRLAERLPASARADAVWAQVDRRVTDQALFAPLFNPRGVAFLSARAGNWLYSQEWGTLYDQLWVR
jgi:peptide/nickel transport system substrate-binding protein